MTPYPIAYGCVDCDGVGVVHDLLMRLEQSGQAERGCLAGLAAGIPHHVGRLTPGRSALILDACPLHCALRAVESRLIGPHTHLDLSQYAFLRKFSRTPREEQLHRVWIELILPAISLLTPTPQESKHVRRPLSA